MCENVLTYKTRLRARDHAYARTRGEPVHHSRISMAWAAAAACGELRVTCDESEKQ